MIGTLLEKLFVSVSADLSDLDAAIHQSDAQIDRFSRDAGRSFQRMGESFKSVGQNMMKSGAVMTAAITAPLALAAKGAYDAAVESAEASAQVESALASMGNAAGRTSEQLDEIAAGLQAASTYDDDEILRSVTANMLTFGNVSGQVFDDAQQMAVDLSARLGQDLQSSTIMLGKALNDPVKGLTALSRVGVSFSEEQEALIKGMAEAGDVAGAQALMLEELRRQYGGAAQAARDAAPGSDQIDQWRELQETFGAMIMDVLPPLLTALGTVMEVFNSLSPELQAVVAGGIAFAAVLGPLVTVIGAVVTGVGAVLPLLAALPAVLGAIGAAFMTLMISPLGLVVAAVAAVVAVWYYWDEIEVVLKRVGAAIVGWYDKNLKPTIDKAMAILEPFVTFFKDYFGAQIEGVINVVSALLRGDFSGAWAAAKEAAAAMLNALAQLAATIALRVIDSLRSIYEGAKTWLKERLGDVFNWLKGKLQDVGGYFFDLYDAVVGNSYVPDMVEGIGEEMAKLRELMVQPAKDATSAVEEAFKVLADRTEGLLSRLFPVRAQLLDILDDLKLLDEALAGGAISKETYDAARGELIAERRDVLNAQRGPLPVGSQGALDPFANGPELEGLKNILVEIPPIASKAQIALEEFGQSMGDGIMFALHSAIEGKGFFKSLKTAFSRTMANIMHEALGDLERGLFGEQGLGGFIGNVIGGLFGGARAVGGPVLPGRAYDVGSGEKFVPGAHGRILSRSDAMAAMQGGSERVEVVVTPSPLFDVEMRRTSDASAQRALAGYDRSVGSRVQSNLKRR